MWCRALAVCLLAARVAAAADAPFMALHVGKPMADRPESLKQVRAALERYPECFDALDLTAAKAGEVSAASTAFCDDHAPRGMLGRAFLFASDAEHTAALIDNGRHCASGKSAHGLCLEAMLCLAYGAERLSFDLVSYGHEPVAWYANTYWSELTLWRPFYREYVRYNQGTKPGGMLPFCGKNGSPALAGTLRPADALAPVGLPMCPGSPWPVCYILNAEAVESMTAVDVQRVLSGGALLDGGAVARLQAGGYGPAMRLSAALRDPGVSELFTDDELNVGRLGYVWQPSAAKESVFALTPSNEAARVIGRYQRADGSVAEAASVLTETASGGRLAVFGFAGFAPDVSAARRLQLLLAADWVSQGRLPVFVETASQAVVVPRVTMAGDLRSVAVLNATIDGQPPLTLRLRGCPEGLETAEWITPKDKPVTLSVRWEEKDVKVTLPALGPWQVGWLRLAPAS
jgi:hypothetical protein